MMYNHDSLYTSPYEDRVAYRGNWTEAQLSVITAIANTGKLTFADGKAFYEAAIVAPLWKGEEKPPVFSILADAEWRAALAKVANTKATVKVSAKLRKKFQDFCERPQNLVINNHGFSKALELGDLPTLDANTPSWLLVHFVWELSRYLRKQECGNFTYSKGEIIEFHTSNPALERWFNRSRRGIERGVWEIYENHIYNSRFDTPESSDGRDDARIPDYGNIERDFLEDPQGLEFQVGFDTDFFGVDRLYGALVRESKGRTPEEIIELAVRAAVRLFVFPIKANKIIDALIRKGQLDANGLKDQILGYLKPGIWHYVQEGIDINRAFPQNPTLGQVSEYLNKVCAEGGPSPTLRSAARNISNALAEQTTRFEAERRFASELERWRGVEPKSFYLKGAYALLLEDAYLGIQEEDLEVRPRESFLADKPLLVHGTPEYEAEFDRLLEELPEPEPEDLSPERFILETLGAEGSKFILPALKAAQDEAGDAGVTPWEAFLPEEGFGGVERPFSNVFRTRLSEENYDEWICKKGRPKDRLAEKRVEELNAGIAAENARRAAIRKFLDSFDREAFLEELDDFNAQLRRDRAHLSDWEQPTFDTNDFAGFKEGDPCDF